jgi:molecular chaperone HtpG
MSQVQKTSLMVYLKHENEAFHAKALELREEVSKWLTYVPQTFPHYTRHTIDHSDEIVSQVSKLLFYSDDPEQPVVKLSGAEAYILVASAYLHDAGMVVSDHEKAEILKSSDWANWTTGEGGGAKRWQYAQELRNGKEPADESLRNFLADVQVRFLIAEFVRARHHLRAADLLTQQQSILGRFAFDDPMLLRTIADTCIAHGLKQHELEDRERYPDRRDILGDLVNVRFIAVLLRLGDLLDMRHDRACPLLLNAACPLPAESLAHWAQYQRITHRLTASDKIEITAECQNQDEHRYLQDWCHWLVEEAHNAAVVISRTNRHNQWKPPVVEVDGDSPTIIIRPTKNANYIPSQWTFQLDPDVVFERLIRDVYERPQEFIRELIQNALDAMRCQLYFDLKKAGLEEPSSPTQVAEERRMRYPLNISLQFIETTNPLSGEPVKRQVLTIDDCGIGMDREVIERYFLQVGRSFYTTEDFRRNYRFVATSRFGLGFLSVFAVSDRVVVDTFKPTSPNASVDGPINLVLTGPRNYLLAEKGLRHTNGTGICVFLRESMDQGDLTELITGWCRRVEFPIFVDDLGKHSTILSEKPDSFL